MLKGTPAPTLSWTKENSHGPVSVAELVTTGDNVATLELTRVTRHSAGHYTYTAVNGYRPVTKTVIVRVEHSPEIHVDTSVVLTKMGAEEQISCNVHAYPKASVSWMKV